MTTWADKNTGEKILAAFTLINDLVVLANKPFDYSEYNDDYLETFRLAAFGMTNKEIAEQQNITASNVGTRLWTLKKSHGFGKRELTKNFFERFFQLLSVVSSEEKEDVHE